MAKTYKVLVNGGSEAETKPINVMQGVGDKGSPVRIVAQKGVRYELQDEAKGKGAAPDQVRVKRVGKNLTLMFDGSQKPDVVLEDFYAVGSANDGNLPVLAGLAENGSVYEYIPQDPALNSVTPALADGNTPVLMALGGGALGDGFVLSALPLAAAAGGLSGWAIAGAAVGAAALGGGGGGGGGAAADTTAPGIVTLAVPEAADGSVNATEAADGTPVNVVLPADAVVGDTVTTVLTKPDGSKQTLAHVLTAADIAAKSITQQIPVADLKDANGNYIDGTWTVTTTVTDAAKNVSTPVQSTFVLDTTAPSADNISGHLKHDAANDTGAAQIDSITSNSTPVLVVNAETGATVDVLVNGKTYRATESTTTKGEYEVSVLDKLDDVTYTPSITVTDKAGNKTTKEGVAFTVDTSSDTNPANGTSTDKNPTDQNTGATTAIAITAVSDDTGSSNTDFITSDKSVLISGTVTNFYNAGASAGDAVHVQIFDANGKRVAQAYATPLANGNSTWAMNAPTAYLKDGDYTIQADIVDAAGNTVKPPTSQALTISANYLSAVPDEATAQEAGIDAFKQPISSINPTGNVLSNDKDVSSTGRVVTGAKKGTDIAVALTDVTSANALKLQGEYGELVIGADGTYKYTVDNAKADHLAAGEAPTETFTYAVKSSNGSSSSATLTVKVTGENDQAVFDDTKSSYKGTVDPKADTVSGTVTVSDVDTNQAGFSNPTQLNGQYGSFNFSSNGGSAKWVYQVDRAKGTFAALYGGQEATDTLNITSLDGSATKSVVVTVTGVNDAPVLTSDLGLAVTSENRNTAQPDTNSLKGATKVLDLVGHITDVDSQSLMGIAVTGVGDQGTLWYSVDRGVSWQCAKDTLTDHALLLAADDKTYVYFQQTQGTPWDASHVTKSFTFSAWDQTSDIAGDYVNASSAGGATAFSTSQQDVLVNNIFNIADTSNMLSVKGGTGFDTLVLNGSLDLTNATSTQLLSGIEKIDITGQGANTIKLNLASVTQADVIGSIHTLLITGDNGDAVNLVKPQGWDVASSLPTQTVNHIAYSVYHLDSTHDLLIQQAITNITFS
jgi:VCBS repeat-containing protein